MKSVFLISIFFLTSCAEILPRGDKSVKLTILHTNDHHGHFWENMDGEYGLAARATMINQIKKEVKKMGGEVLLLDAGDVNTGVPQSDLLDAEPDFRGMSAIGYDAMVIGNHEFDNSLKTIFKQQKEWAKFPFLSANIYNQNNERVFPSHIKKNISGVRVIIFGLTTEDTPKKSNPIHSKDLIFRPAVDEAKSIVPKLRKEADVLIAVTHTGHYKNELHGLDAPGDVTIARQAKGIDLIIGGHTQIPLFKPDIQNGTLIVQAHEWGKYLGRIDLEILKGKVHLTNYKLIPINLKDSEIRIKPNKKIEEMLRPYKIKGDQSLLIEIGHADEEFIGKREIVRSQETNLGNLIARSYKDKFNANFSILNSGGIRDSLYPGPITIEDILTILPFGGEVVTVELTGKEVQDYLNTIITSLSPGSGNFPQMAGVQIEVFKKTNKIKSIRIEGKKINFNQKYLIALPEFVARGGDNYPVLKFRKYGYVDADVLKEYILNKKHLKAKNFLPSGYIKFDQ